MIARKNAAVLIMVLSMIVSLVGCASKTYASLEEWYADNPQAMNSVETSLSQADSSNNMTIEFAVEDNKIIYRYQLNEKLFGLDDQMDSNLKATLDNNLEAQRDNFIKSIDNASLSSGVDAGLISVHLDYYNPGDSEPSFSQVVTK